MAERERIARERAVEFRTSMEGITKLPESDRYVHRPVYVAPNRALQARAQLDQFDGQLDFLGFRDDAFLAHGVSFEFL